MNIIDDPLSKIVSHALGIRFSTKTNNDLCPSQKASTIIFKNGRYQQLDTNWGIQPSWSTRLLINAQSETVAEKQTFKNAFSSSRCLVPCSGWYEWRTEEGKKVKYLFSHAYNQPLYMGGITYQSEVPQLVTLTTSPNKKCMQYHKRMPVVVLPENIDYWFNSSPEQLQPLMQPVGNNYINVSRIG